MDNAGKTHGERNGRNPQGLGGFVSRDVMKYLDYSVVGDSSTCRLGVKMSFRYVITFVMCAIVCFE